MGTPPLTPRSYSLYRLSRWRRIAVLRASLTEPLGQPSRQGAIDCAELLPFFRPASPKHF